MSGMFFIIGFAFIVGFILIFATSFSGQKRDDGIGAISATQGPSFERYVRICSDIVEALKLEIDGIETTESEQTLDIYAHSPAEITGVNYIIHAAYHNVDYVVSAGEIVELSNAIIQDRLSKGIFITTGKFTEELPSISELAPMAFIDGTKLKELADQHKIPLKDLA